MGNWKGKEESNHGRHGKDYTDQEEDNHVATRKLVKGGNRRNLSA
jgi:hypothetical protein